MKILFVCYANICRSALAEVVLKKKLLEKGLTDIEVESAGVHNYAGAPRDYMMSSYAHKAGYELGGTARYVTQPMIDSADLIICMEHAHVVMIQRLLAYERWSRIYTFNEICFGEQTGLIDPSGDTGYVYHYVLEKIQEGCAILAWELEKMVNHGEIFFQRK